MKKKRHGGKVYDCGDFSGENPLSEICHFPSWKQILKLLEEITDYYILYDLKIVL